MEKLMKVKSKIMRKEEVSGLMDVWKYMGLKIVFTNGCFDIIHLGHIDYLARAASLGGKLIIGLNTDASVSRLKGTNRPIQDEQSRALILASLQFVDAVILFDEETPQELISFLIPDILVKGSDYRIDQIVGADVVLNNGGKVETMDFVPGYSTSNIIEKIKQSN
jgi:rfaE bifunctional protein nucleotidyltransferase chain/domain